MGSDFMDGLERAAALLPPDMRPAALSVADAEEFRLRSGRRPAYLSGDAETELDGCRAVTPEDLDGVLERATRASVHSAQSSLKNGFVTVAGGVRLGVCGSVILSDGAPAGIRRLSGAAVRIPRQVGGCCDGTLPALTDGGFKNTLIISRPGGGKTTYLRELIRRLSDSGARVGLADERGEVAAVWNGVPQFDVGRRTDVMSDAPKAASAEMLLRSMNPQILAMDEITAPGDVEAVFDSVGCGVKLLATAHAGSWNEFCSRRLYRAIVTGRIFKRVVIIEANGGARSYSVEEKP